MRKKRGTSDKGGKTHVLRCLNTVCARSTICTADVNKRVHKALRKTNMAPVGACTAIISFSSVKIGQVFLPS